MCLNLAQDQRLQRARDKRESLGSFCVGLLEEEQKAIRHHESIWQCSAEFICQFR